jgi:hypothetical protein
MAICFYLVFYKEGNVLLVAEIKLGVTQFEGVSAQENCNDSNRESMQADVHQGDEERLD